MKKLTTFDDWVDYFHAWQESIGLSRPSQGELKEYPFETKFDDLRHQEIEFGHFKGEKKWERVIEIPDQRIRDALLTLVVYQGDTEFASVEQQRNLFNTAPNDEDLAGLARVMGEEMRHGWQMAYLLMTCFGEEGKLEARKLLERRSFQKTRLLGSFNEDVDNWLDFFTYTEFVDRDGKFQLKMLSSSAFAPLARSMGPMLKEEAYHLSTGHDGLRRILKAGKIPVSIIQKYFNKWIPTAYDLFGTDHSSSASWNYLWGLKGRFDEEKNSSPPDREHLNEAARELYYQEVISLMSQMNELLKESPVKLYAPDLRFGRKIGDFAGQPYSVRGEILSPEAYESHLAEVLPSQKDEEELGKVLRGRDWILSKSEKISRVKA